MQSIKLLTPLTKQSREFDPVSELIIGTVQTLDFQRIKIKEVKYAKLKSISSVYTEMTPLIPYSQQNIFEGQRKILYLRQNSIFPI